MATRAFQRLRNIKQLGLAHLVFPGADYSRLSHSIGVNHITGRILRSLVHNTGQNIDDAEYQIYRLAGLLHDIGHYPFSHTFENAVSTFYQNKYQLALFADPSVASAHDNQLVPLDEAAQETSLNHEDVGQILLERDPEINAVLAKYEIDPKLIHSVFSRDSSSTGDLPRFANLISSDLDADRIDYLSRTARHTGLPYGSVDIEYLLSQLTLDSDNQICLNPSALRTAEHFLLARYFDYQQVNFHKTVAALEWALHDVINEMLNLQLFDCSPSSIRDMIASGEWYCFDDLEIWHFVRELESQVLPEPLRAKLNTITRRIPPKLIGSFEFLGDRTHFSQHNFGVRLLTDLSNRLSEEFGIHKDLWYVWSSWKMSFTKAGTYLPASMTLTDFEDSADAIAQMVRIRDGDHSKPISEVPRSLISILAQNALFSARLYVLLPSDKESLRTEIADRVDAEIANAGALENWIREK